MYIIEKLFLQIPNANGLDSSFRPLRSSFEWLSHTSQASPFIDSRPSSGRPNLGLVKGSSLPHGDLFRVSTGSGRPLVDFILDRVSATGRSLNNFLLGVCGSFLGFLCGLLDVLFARSCRSAYAGESDNDGNEKSEYTANTTSHFGHELDGFNGILLGESDEQLEFLLDKGDWVIFEFDVGGRLGKVFGLGLVLRIFRLLERSLDIVSLSTESGGVFDRVADVDVVEGDIRLHGPDFKTDL